MVLVPDDLLKTETVGTATFTCGADNQGNSFLLKKLRATKCSLGVVLMELACQSSRRRSSLRASPLLAVEACLKWKPAPGGEGLRLEVKARA